MWQQGVVLLCARRPVPRLCALAVAACRVALASHFYCYCIGAASRRGGGGVVLHDVLGGIAPLTRRW
jgi:hypothetical protein